MATPEDIIEAKRIANARATANAAVSPAVSTPAVDPYYVRDPKTGLSPAQIEANRIVAETAKLANAPVVTGDAGTTNRIFTPYEKGSTSYLGKDYATAAGAYTAAVKTAEKVGPPGPAPAGLHWNLQGTEWKLYDAEGKPFNYIGTGTEDFSGDGTATSPLLYKGKPFNGTRGGVTFVNGVPKGTGGGKVEDRRVTNPDGSVTIFYTDGTSTTIPKTASDDSSGNNGSTTKTTYTAPDGKIFTDLNAYNAYIAQTAADAKRKAGQSAYDILFGEFERYGMGSLLNDVKEFIVQGLSRDELLLKLRGTSAYGQRFAANAQRVKAGLRALSEAEYVGLEDAYQQKMREYGLPASYYTRGDLGRQVGFEKFIAGDVSPAELEDRIQTAQNRVNNAPKQVRDALSQFYGTELGNGDILAYVLDTENALPQIKRKVTAAEIGAGAMQAGLATTRERAEELGAFGVTAQQAREGFQTIGGFLPRATQLSEIYSKQGEGPFTQTIAEQEVFGTTGAVEAQRKRRKLAELETAQFSGTTGASGGALARERAGQF
jgi:hypothetical protein